MTKARCELCGNESLVALDDVEAEEALFCISNGLTGSTVLECVYCTNQQRSRKYEEIFHAYHYSSDVRRLWSKKLRDERQKVTRLQEGRW